MIDIRIKCNGEPFVLTADGHANAPRNEDGRDLVCCAVSTLVQTLAASCAQIPGVRTTYRKESGRTKIHLADTEAHWDELIPRFNMVITGIQVLAEQYPESVSLTVEE